MLPTNNQQNRNVGKESPVMLAQALLTVRFFVPFPAHTHTSDNHPPKHTERNWSDLGKIKKIGDVPYK